MLFFSNFSFSTKNPKLTLLAFRPSSNLVQKMKAILIQIDYYSQFSPYYFHIEDLTYDDVDGAEG